MDRLTWLEEMRSKTEAQYDAIWAPHYGEQYGRYPNSTHQLFIRKLLNLLPRPSFVLDAACGAGRYFPLLLEAGHTVTGVDQSRGMLDRARSLFPHVRLEKASLQELSYHEDFDAAICMDAMENVCPEDWGIVLANLHQAIRPKGFLYFTVETLDEPSIKKAFLRAQKAGLPVIIGEWPDETCYHYYPAMQLVRGWLRQARMEVMEENEGDGYHHFIVRRMQTP